MPEMMALLPFSLGTVACRMESGRELPNKFDMSRMLKAFVHSAPFHVSSYPLQSLRSDGFSPVSSPRFNETPLAKAPWIWIHFPAFALDHVAGSPSKMKNTYPTRPSEEAINVAFGL